MIDVQLDFYGPGDEEPDLSVLVSWSGIPSFGNRVYFEDSDQPEATRRLWGVVFDHIWSDIDGEANVIVSVRRP
jgi:hypothetical protein